MAIFVVIMGLLHIASVFSLKEGKLVTSESKLALFGAAIAYIITMLICGI
jgi:hypothetical protein